MELKKNFLDVPFTSMGVRKFYLLRVDDGIISSIKKLMVDLPCPINISYIWNFGSLLGLALFVQLVTGILLSFHYISDISLAFSSIDRIMREVRGGWIVRFIHIRGASLYFLFIYFHMARGLYFSSFLLLKTWLVGVFIFLLSMAVAFLGYVLPWGQMSYWGATVITNFFSVIPYVGPQLVIWIWGGFAVDYPTLTRFFSLHFLLPMIIVVLVIIHLVFLHETGSSNPLGLTSKAEKIYFFPHFALKDIFGFFFFFFLIIIFFLFPKIFAEYQNFLEANPLVTPTHIQPEWYFLPAYAVLRAIPSKLGGVLGLVFFVIIFFFVPLISRYRFRGNLAVRRFSLKWGFQFVFWVWIINYLFLTWIGACPVEFPFLQLSRGFSLMYFIFFLVYLDLGRKNS